MPDSQFSTVEGCEGTDNQKVFVLFKLTLEMVRRAQILLID